MTEDRASLAKVLRDDNSRLAQMLRDACSLSAIPNNIKLPGSIGFHLDNGTVRLHMTDKCVSANMQDNSSSFEGWALSFKRWLTAVEKVELSWDGTDSILDPHYQRFLYRVQQFRLLFSDWFSITHSQNEEALGQLRTETGLPLVVTSPKKVRETALRDQCDSMSGVIANEHKLECYIKDHPTPLARLLGLESIDRQFPVGLFEGHVKKQNEIFPRGHSAIDLWGLRDNELFLFELKAKGNTRVGILSELFFYSYIMEGVQTRRYALQDDNDVVGATNVVHSYILAPQWHPLIDAGMLTIANTAFKRAGRKIRFGMIKIHPAQESFELQMAAGID